MSDEEIASRAIETLLALDDKASRQLKKKLQQQQTRPVSAAAAVVGVGTGSRRRAALGERAENEPQRPSQHLQQQQDMPKRVAKSFRALKLLPEPSIGCVAVACADDEFTASDEKK